MWWILLRIILQLIGPYIVKWIIDWIDRWLDKPGDKKLTYEEFVEATGKNISPKDFDRVKNYYLRNLNRKVQIRRSVELRL